MPRAIPSGFLGLVSALIILSPQPMSAQSAAEAPTSVAAPPSYNAANEVVVRGSISQVLTQPAPGLPFGLHLVISTPQGTVDAHLGPFLAPFASQKGLVPGAAVEMVGVTIHLPAGDVFLVRSVVLAGRTIVVRNSHGFPVRQVAPGQRVVRGAEQKDGL